jgi:hypothetical protein
MRRSKKGNITLEELQIQAFVQRAGHDEAFRKELASDPQTVIERETSSPLVARVLLRMVPQLTLVRLDDPPSFGWWH